MSIETLRLQLRYYWLQMNEAKKAGDEEAYSVYRDKYRELLIHKKASADTDANTLSSIVTERKPEVNHEKVCLD